MDEKLLKEFLEALANKHIPNGTGYDARNLGWAINMARRLRQEVSDARNTGEEDVRDKA